MTLAARWWTEEQDGPHTVARCHLCPHACLIPQGKGGWCGSRFYDGRELESPYLGLFSSIAVDPIEKKPLHHWRSGAHILSLGSLGCTMRCPFCQNHSIAQPDRAMKNRQSLRAVPVETLATMILDLGLRSVAFTYNEPALQAEYILAAVPLLKDAGIETVLVSNGMYSSELLHALAPNIDAANIDVKCFNSKTYARLGGSLEAVQRTVTGLLEAGVHVEATTLVVPGVSDSVEEFAAELEWLCSVSPNIPLHISRYRPAYKFTAPPTDIELLHQFYDMAAAKLTHVHIGNAPARRP